jgi:two-component system cell cycle response regulator DivK
MTVSNELILIVEDNEKNMKLASDILAIKGYRVVGADNAEDGVRLAKEHQPDIVLMDVQLPGMDGFAGLRAIREDATTRHIVVAAFTASVMKEDVTRIHAAGFDGYIGKPLSVREFPNQVAELTLKIRSHG